MPPGCRFAPRCPVAETRCATVPPPSRTVGFAPSSRPAIASVEAGLSVWSLPQAAE